MIDEPTYLVADIGATNARFASYRAERVQSVTLATTGADSAAALFEMAREQLECSRLAGCCAAVAGPVQRGAARITNGGLGFSERELSALLRCRVHLVNDFYALARALPLLREFRQIGGGEPVAGGVQALIGPGSGLGMAMLVPDAARRGGWRVLPSEGGHGDLAPGNHLELEVLSILHQQHSRVSWESVLSGPGLVTLYRAVAEIWGSKPAALAPEDVSARGVDAADPVCHQTLELFFGWLGAAAGNLALMACARGGVYLGGGIVPGLVDFAEHSSMRRRFEERADLEAFALEVPLYVIMDAQPGLTGALACWQDVHLEVVDGA